MRLYTHLQSCLYSLSVCVDTEFHEVEDVEDTPDAEVAGQRFTRDVLDHLPVNDYVSTLLCQPRTTP